MAKEFGDEESCPSNKQGHEPNWATLAPAGDGINHGHADRGVVDVECRHCGRSGSVPVLAEDVNW